MQAAFLVQAAAYCLSVFATSRIKTRGDAGAARDDVGASRAWPTGFGYARSHADVRLLVIMAGLPSLLVYPYVQFIPVFAKDVLHVGSVGFGFLASAVGYGSIIGALLAANLTGLKKRGQILVWTTFVYMALVTAFALSNVYALSFTLPGGRRHRELHLPDVQPGDDPADRRRRVPRPRDVAVRDGRAA